jgi:hypothetical protein
MKLSRLIWFFLTWLVVNTAKAGEVSYDVSVVLAKSLADTEEVIDQLDLLQSEAEYDESISQFLNDMPFFSSGKKASLTFTVDDSDYYVVNKKSGSLSYLRSYYKVLSARFDIDGKEYETFNSTFSIRVDPNGRHMFIGAVSFLTSAPMDGVYAENVFQFVGDLPATHSEFDLPNNEELSSLSSYDGELAFSVQSFSSLIFFNASLQTRQDELVDFTFVQLLDTDRDGDSDGVLDDSDNCPSTPNPDQADLDGDNIGDACDSDVDGDSIENTSDNCPVVANSDQLDADGDLIGDACDDLIDNDADGIANDLDNCPAVPNAGQADNDGDLQGDACDLDDDNDGVEDTVDNCSLTANEDQADNDSDNIGDVCDSDDDNDAIEDDLDNCPIIANVGQDDNDGDGFGDVCDPDDDNDAVDDSVDNCPLSFNPDQSNTDGVGAGDACNDAFDVDDDDWENDYDNCPDVANRNQSDYDYDNIGDACDSDVDGDEVANAADACELTPLGELVGSIGCSIEQLCPCDAPRQSTEPWKNHGQYVSCMTKAAQSFAADEVISDNEKSDLVNAAAQSSCGY